MSRLTTNNKMQIAHAVADLEAVVESLLGLPPDTSWPTVTGNVTDTGSPAQWRHYLARVCRRAAELLEAKQHG